MLLRASITRSFLTLAIFLLAAEKTFSLSPPVSLPEASSKDSENHDSQVMNDLLEVGFDAYVDENYEKAVLSFQRVLEMNPQDKTAKKGMKQSQKMLEIKLKAAQISEKDRLKSAHKFILKEKWLEAIDLTVEVLLLNPNSREALEIQNEVSAICRGKMSDPKAPVGNELIYQGIINYLNKRYDEAIKLWREAGTFDSDNFKILIYIERAEQALYKIDKHEVLLSRDRAKSLFKEGSLKASEDLWFKILEYLPEDNEAKSWLEKIQKEFKKSKQEGKIGDYYDKGLEFFNKGDYAQSLKMWNGILEIDPKNEVAKVYVERVRKKMGSVPLIPNKGPVIDKPVQPMDTASVSDESKLKEEAQKYYTQGSLYYSQGQLDDAMKEWREAIRIYPAHAPTLKMLEKISAGKGGQKR